MRVVRVERRGRRRGVGCGVRATKQHFDPLPTLGPLRPLVPGDRVRQEHLRELSPAREPGKFHPLVGCGRPVITTDRGDELERADVGVAFCGPTGLFEPPCMVGIDPETIKGLRSIDYSTPGSGSSRM